jgi:nucleoside-diphosphate-sugar epimerase
MSTLLVTGGGGFVMSHLARQWVDAAPANRAVVLDAAPLDADAAAFLASDRIRVLQGSVLDPVAWEAVPEPAAITHIVHGAAVTSIQREADARGIAAVVPALGVNIPSAARR